MSWFLGSCLFYELFLNAEFTLCCFVDLLYVNIRRENLRMKALKQVNCLFLSDINGFNYVLCGSFI